MLIIINKHFRALSSEAARYKMVLKRLLSTKLKLLCWNSTCADAPPNMNIIIGESNEWHRNTITHYCKIADGITS
jgi:hypothetical protein